MSGELRLEQRYRRVLRLLPGYYREQWEEDMVAAFLDSCPAGSARLPRAAEQFPDSNQCYRRLGSPLTITSAAVTYIQQPTQKPANYGLMISVPAEERPALTAITAQAYHSGDPVAIIAAGKTWGVPNVAAPFTGRFEIPAQSSSQALQLQRTLIPSA